MQIKQALQRGGALLGCTALLVAAGGIANADISAPAKIPSDGEIKLCYNKSAARNTNGGAGLRIYDADKNEKRCKEGDKKLTIDLDDFKADLAAGQAASTAQLTLDGNDAFTAIPGLTFALPADGRYQINADLPAYIQTDGITDSPDPDAVACALIGRLLLNGVPVANSERVLATKLIGFGLPGLDSTSLTQLVDTAGPATLVVQAAVRCVDSDEATVAIADGPAGADVVEAVVNGPTTPANSIPNAVASWTLINED